MSQNLNIKSVKSRFQSVSMESFSISDPVHGKITYPAYIRKLIHTEEFQRLRNLKQLGVSYQVYYAGTHTRFEHCLG